MSYAYKPLVLEQLAAHGLKPGPDTTPQKLREAINDLYRYEIRRLRERYVGGAFSKPEYVEQVVALRKKYILLSVPIWKWTD